MNSFTFFRLCLLTLFLISCTGKTEGISDFQTGQTFNPSNGKITDTSLAFRIKKYRKGGKNQDLFDYIYFQGDNLCFSFKFSQRTDPEKITVKFSHPVSGLTFPAERIDIIDNRCFGFSLLGSLLEKLYEDLLDNKVSIEMFCCRKIKFDIIVEVVKDNKPRTYRFPESFSIKYF